MLQGCLNCLVLQVALSFPLSFILINWPAAVFQEGIQIRQLLGHFSLIERRSHWDSVSFYREFFFSPHPLFFPHFLSYRFWAFFLVVTETCNFILPLKPAGAFAVWSSRIALSLRTKSDTHCVPVIMLVSWDERDWLKSAAFQESNTDPWLALTVCQALF